MGHESIRGLLPAYIDGYLPDEEYGRVDRHLRACDACSAVLLRLRRIEALVASGPAEPADMRMRAARVDAAVLREIRRKRRPGRGLGRVLNLAGLTAFVLLMGLAVGGVAAMLSRMDPRPSSNPAVAGWTPERILVHERGRETSYKPGSERFTELARRVDDVLRKVNGRVAESSGYDELVHVDMEQQPYVEVIFPEPGVKLGGHGPYTTAAIPLSVPPDEVQLGARLWIYLGNGGRYTRLAGADAGEELNALLVALGHPAYFEPMGPGVDRDEAQAQGVVSRFQEAMVGYLGNAGRSPQQAARRYEAEARSYLTPEYNASVGDLGQLGVPGPQLNGGAGSQSVYRDVRIAGDRGTLTRVEALSKGGGTWLQGYTLHRDGRGEWRINHIEPARRLSLEEILADDQLRKFEEYKVFDVVRSLYEAVLHAGSKPVNASPQEEPRDLLAPGYESGAADLRRLLGGRRMEPGGPVTGVSGPGETHIVGETATYITSFPEAPDRRIRFDLSYTDGGWKVTRIGPVEGR
jgi:hypothetical protein